MNDKPRSRWFRISLRTFFILLTVICCWLGWELSIVKQRQSLLNNLRSKPGFSITTADSVRKNFVGVSPFGKPAEVPLYRRWLGDEAIQEIGYSYQPPAKEELARIERVFPEAKVVEHQPHLMEPCHPGCFPAGTLVETPQGKLRIETIAAGDAIIAIDEQGEPFKVNVESVFVTDNQLWRVQTTAGELLTTKTQPLCVAAGRVLQVGDLQSGDVILRRAGDDVEEVTIVSIAQTEQIEKVFNLILGNSEIFVANGYLARSKPPALYPAKVTTADVAPASVAQSVP